MNQPCAVGDAFAVAHEAVCAFEELRIGDQFFDPVCGETFEKVAELRACFLTRGDAFEAGEVDFKRGQRVQFLDPIEASVLEHRERRSGEAQ